MKYVKVRSLKYLDPAVNWDFEAVDPSGKLTELIASGALGLSERPELDAEGHPTGGMLPAEYTIEIEDITAQVEQQKINEEALAYLASTDWMVIRAMDAGIPCPEEVKQARSEARAKIVR